jgi:hypothetical protein
MFNRTIFLSLLLIVSSFLARLVLKAFISTLEHIEQPLLLEALESSFSLGMALVLYGRTL